MNDSGTNDAEERILEVEEDRDENSSTDEAMCDEASASASVHFRSRVFTLPKDLESPHLYEDAAVVDETRGRIAIADGVSAAIFSRQWAQIITQGLIADPPSVDDKVVFADWLNKCRQAWRAGIDTSKLKFYQRAKMADGAFTTILWCEVIDVDSEMGRTFRAYALGDTCLFHVREGAVLEGFPIQTSAEFGLNPNALQSIDRYGKGGLPDFMNSTFRCLPGDLLVLCTDAVAQWAFQRSEAGNPVDWSVYWDLPESEWQAEIIGLRNEAAMRVDDCTLVLLRFDNQTPMMAGEHGEQSSAETISDPASIDPSIASADESHSDSTVALTPPLTAD